MTLEEDRLRRIAIEEQKIGGGKNIRRKETKRIAHEMSMKLKWVDGMKKES